MRKIICRPIPPQELFLTLELKVNLSNILRDCFLWYLCQCMSPTLDHASFETKLKFQFIPLHKPWLKLTIVFHPGVKSWGGSVHSSIYSPPGPRSVGIVQAMSDGSRHQRPKSGLWIQQEGTETKNVFLRWAAEGAGKTFQNKQVSLWRVRTGYGLLVLVRQKMYMFLSFRVRSNSNLTLTF